jgi:hypothetical protein
MAIYTGQIHLKVNATNAGFIMIIEFELQGSKMLHKGIFDTSGLWVKYEPEIENGVVKEDGSFEWEILGWKLYSHFSFTFYHTDKETVDLVYSRLISVLRGANSVEIEDVGYFRKVNK